MENFFDNYDHKYNKLLNHFYEIESLCFNIQFLIIFINEIAIKEP